MGKKSQVILIGGSPGLNSKHVLLSPGCPDLTGRAKDNLNNVGWAGEISIHCRSRGNGVLRMRAILTRLPARRSLFRVSYQKWNTQCLFLFAAGVGKGARRAHWYQTERFLCKRTFVLNGKKIGE